jgi:transcription antitermination factor NusG
MASHWIILRCSGRSTIGLAESLTKDGYEAWTPVETRTVRVPRANAKREIRNPIMPSYVFARLEHLVDLIQLAAMPVKPRRGAGLREPAHADFSVLHCFDKIPVVADKDLTELRRIEIKRTPVKKAERAFRSGALVRVNGGSFGGMSGEVQRSDRAHTIVCFSNRWTVKVFTSLLAPDEAYSFQSAALKAA